MGDAGRRYTEKEFALILRKAAELQERPDVRAAAEGGLTLNEISAIAQEVGLEAALVARAAGELDAERPTGLTRFLGGSARHRAPASVPAVLAPEAYPAVLDAIRSATGRHGEARETLGSLEWHAADGVTRLYVTVTPGPEATHVVLTADRSGGQAAVWVASIFASLFAVGVTGAIVAPSTVEGGLGLGAGILGAGLLTARTLWASATRRFKERMEGALERITRGIATGKGPEPPS
ncbi:MAG: hypothetical protein FIA95_07565 [Gemmatimonadetes bacterium]|nr:hypothetical protein [Gemmatimonadota bacterium]